MYLARFTTATATVRATETETLKVYLLFMINCGLQACQTVRSWPPNRLNQARGGGEDGGEKDKGPERDFEQL